jgi:DNA polymerase-3 subunit epsilon
MILVFDTETSGKANFRLPFDHPTQPHLVQLGAQLLDDSLFVRHQLDMIVRPEGFTIPVEAANVHGISQEMAEQIGLPLKVVLEAFAVLFNKAHTRVAHNIEFDYLVILAARQRSGVPFNKAQKRFCTMQAMTPICNLPGNYGKPKWPKLSEAYKHCLGCELEGAHDALTDVKACASIYRWLRDQTKVENANAA